jgi:hypothetical protein
MSETIFASGAFDWRGGSVTFEDLPWILTQPADTDEPVLATFNGSADVYDLGAVNLFGFGTMAFHGGSATLLLVQPYGGFEDFAIFPETGSDPLNGFVVNSTSLSSGGVGNAWTRHYVVMVPPKKARFAVPHIKLATVVVGNNQYFDAHQLEMLRTSQSAPTAFGSARSLQVTVRPKRLNFAVGSTTVTKLTPFRVYTASADVAGQRVSFQFTPTSDTYTLNFGGTPSKILVEEGTEVGDYFDGNSGDDYLWEQGGTPGATRSYYYPDRTVRHEILTRTLAENVALGIPVADPVYALFPAPSSTG